MRKPKKRCALYTRKSSEEGLEQEFNSLDAQRDACAAYAQSQASEGWRVSRTLYDDGGYSGGSMERPALQRLLADIAAGKIDVVVVYKIDRLTRSLADFARIVECFDRHGVSFVSVTQAFNTTSSMGRLMLNVLLSFAQFEREVTGERIRDKIRASKAKGMWMGGVPPLGYNVRDKKLVVNEAEAQTVRAIFETYLELGSVHALERDLDERGIRSKQRITRSGGQSGGRRFSRGALFHLLRNRLYLGLIVHKGEAHPGLHSAIVSSEMFEVVQQSLDAQTRRHAECRNPVEQSPLTGRLFDADGQRMSPTFSYGRSGKLYRYYVSAQLQQGKRPTSDDQNIRRVPAAALEDRLADVIKRLLPYGSDNPLASPTRVEVHPQNLQVLLPIRYLARIRTRLGKDEQAEQDLADPSHLRLMVAGRLKTRRGGRTSVIEGAEPSTNPDPALIKALREAHALLEWDAPGLPFLEAAPSSSHKRRLIRIAFLAPDLQQAILEGRQQPGLTLGQIIDSCPPLLWSEQAAQFGKPIEG